MTLEEAKAVFAALVEKDHADAMRIRDAFGLEND